MNISLDNNSFVVSIDIEKYNLLCRNFNKLNIANPKFIQGIKSEDHAYGCKQSHILIIQHAKDNNLPYCIIFEDDAYPCVRCKDIFNDIMVDILNNNIDWDILVLGICGEHSEYTNDIVFHDNKIDKNEVKLSKNVEYVTSKLMKVHKNPHGSHAYVIKENALDEFLYNLKTKYEPVDFLLGSDMFKYNKVVFTLKMLFIQRFMFNGLLRCHYPYFYNELQCLIGPIKWLSDDLPIGFL